MDGGGGMKLSVVMPARSEEESVGQTVESVAAALDAEGIDYELVVVDDHSTDQTAAVVDRISAENSRVRCVRSSYGPGFGFAVRAGLNEYSGDAVVVMMADGSDHPGDLVRYQRELEEGWECVFGSRFIRGAKVYRYPRIKLVINRLANWFIRTIFRHHYNDTTNAFKAYRREVIDRIQPLLSNHFNLTVEMPLKAIVRGHTFRVVPVSWTGRSTGSSKLGIREMGSRYLFIVLYVWLEAHLSRGDYRKREAGALDRGDEAQPARRQSRSRDTGSTPASR
jgi:dolichol-phosphate mannosyltransferase